MRRFNYFDDWKNVVLKCPSCHWQGLFEKGSVEHYMDQMDCACPTCAVSKSPILAVVLYPTLPELRANMDKPGVREWVEQIDRGFDEFEAQKLREPAQLPDIVESSFEVVWDFDNSKPDDPRTVLKHGDIVIFSEPARYEEFKRFGEVCEVLKAKYGGRIKDLVPTLRSEDWLYGAASEGKNFVEWFRHQCFGVSLAKQWQSRSATESLTRSLRVQEVANQHINPDDSQPQLALKFDAQSERSHEHERDENASNEPNSNAPKTNRPVPGVPGASWEQTEYGTKLVLEPNSEFDSLPKEKQDEVLDRMLQCFDKPNHIQRVTALRDEFADGIAQKTPRPPADCPSAFSSFRNGPELPDIDAEELTLVFDYSNDGSKYFVLYGEQVILSGPAADDPEDHVTDNALGGQFVDIATKLKKRYGTKLVDLVPTPKASNMLMDLWGWALHRDSGRRIAQAQSMPPEAPKTSSGSQNHSPSQEIAQQKSAPLESRNPLAVGQDDLDTRHLRGPFHKRSHAKVVLSILVGFTLLLGASIARQHRRRFQAQATPAGQQSSESTTVYKVLERNQSTPDLLQFQPWVNVALLHNGKVLHARCNNIKAAPKTNDPVPCKLRVGDAIMCQSFTDRMSDDAGGYDLICGDDRSQGKLITSDKNELLQIADYDAAYKAKEEAELVKLPKLPPTIIYDEWWSSDYASNTSASCSSAIQKLCESEARGKEDDFLATFSGAFQSDAACDGMRLVAERGVKNGETMNSKQEAKALSEGYTREHLFLTVNFVPDRAKQEWTVMHFAANNPHGLPDRSAKGENDAYSLAHAVCGIARNRGGAVVE